MTEQLTYMMNGDSHADNANVLSTTRQPEGILRSFCVVDFGVSVL